MECPNSRADADLKNAFSAAQAFFTEHPGGTADLKKLYDYGFVPSSHVTTIIRNGRQASLQIESFHRAGTKVYRVDAPGSITSGPLWVK